jgi:hypothetical protein
MQFLYNNISFLSQKEKKRQKGKKAKAEERREECQSDSC